MRREAPCPMWAIGPTFAPAGDWLTMRGTDRNRHRRHGARSDLTACPRGFQVELVRLFPQNQMQAGLRAREQAGTCRMPIAHRFPATMDQCTRWGSFSLTAAGQPRIHTEFPFNPLSNTQRNQHGQQPIVVQPPCQPRCSGLARCARRADLSIALVARSSGLRSMLAPRV